MYCHTKCSRVMASLSLEITILFQYSRMFVVSFLSEQIHRLRQNRHWWQWKTVTPSHLHLSVEQKPHTRQMNLFNPTGCMMDQQFNIQQLYALPTLYLCVLYLSQNKQRIVPLTA